MSIPDTTIQIIKLTIGNGPGFVNIYKKAIIAVTTTMMVRVKGILRDSFILWVIHTIIPPLINYAIIFAQTG
jgi:hypothetical protein